MKKKKKKTKPAKIKVLKEGDFIRFVQKGVWEYIELNQCTGIVIIVAVNKKNEVIFVEQYRPPLAKKCIEFPAGLVNHNTTKKETLAMGAKRELLEETGYKAQKMVKLLKGPIAAGSCSSVVVMFKALGLKKVAEGGGDQYERIKVHEVPMKRVVPWLRSKERQGFLVEPKIYSGLYFLQNRLK